MQVDVLLVDDEKHILTAIGRVLRQSGISHASTSNGEEALLWLESNQAELILADYKMPGISGTEFLAKVEAGWPETIRIILSGHADFDTVLKAVNTGVAHKFLAKPWNNQELIEHIKSSLASQQIKTEPRTSKLRNHPNQTKGHQDPSEVKLQVVLDTVVDGIVTINQQGIILSANAAIERIFGHNSNDLIGKNVSMLMPEPYRSQHDHYLSQYQSPGMKGILGNQRRLVGLRKNGEVFPIELSVNSMQIEGSTQFLGMIRDISRRVSAESENQLLLDALETAQDGVALFGPGDRLTHCNKQFRKLYREAGVELHIGQTYKSFFLQCLNKGLFPTAQKDPEKWLKQQIRSHAQLPMTEEYELQSGQWIEIHETQAENGSVIVSHLDISKQKRTQLSLAKAAEEAKHANSARGRFLAMMSHEIRTPLNGVLGLLQLLQESQLTDNQKQYVNSALSSGRGLLTILTDILDFSKIDADKLDLFPEPCHLQSLICELEQLFQFRIEEKSILLITSISPEVPEWVQLDGQRLRQILINLLGNAIKFTDYGEVSLRIAITNNQLNFQVKDSGIGIADEEQGKIFSEFTTIENTAAGQLYEGTGLGLSICHKLVHLMGGTIDFSSQQGRGSEFCFQLPLQSAKAPQNEKQTDSGKLHGHVLVVDDSDTNRLVARTMLESFGLQVTSAVDGQKALGCYSAHKFDLILMDISMPGMNGVETFNQLRKMNEWARTPVIAFTAYAQFEDKARFSKAGMQGYLEKPLEKTVLLQTITPFLSHQNAPAKTRLTSINTEETTRSEQLLDIGKLDQLAKDTSEELLPQLADVFINDVETRLKQLSATEIDSINMERHLHTLSSSAALYGLQPLALEAKRLEKICRELQGATDMGEQLSNFIKLAASCINALQEHLQTRNQ